MESLTSMLYSGVFFTLDPLLENYVSFFRLISMVSVSAGHSIYRFSLLFQLLLKSFLLAFVATAFLIFNELRNSWQTLYLSKQNEPTMVFSTHSFLSDNVPQIFRVVHMLVLRYFLICLSVLVRKRLFGYTAATWNRRDVFSGPFHHFNFCR